MSTPNIFIVAKLMPFSQIKEYITKITIISKKGRMLKHRVGKTIRRRNSDDEVFYGEAKHMLNVLYKVKEAKRFSDDVEVFPNEEKNAMIIIKKMTSFIQSNSEIIDNLSYAEPKNKEGLWANI